MLVEELFGKEVNSIGWCVDIISRPIFIVDFKGFRFSKVY